MKRSHDAHPGLRGALLCCGAAMGALIPVALFQLRLLKKLPDPPGPVFDSARIVTSKDAFPLGIPDGLLGLGSYGATFLLLLAAEAGAGSGGLETALKAKLLMDGSMAGWNSAKQWRNFGRICSWCMAAAAATGAMVCFGYGAMRSRGSANAQDNNRPYS